MTSYYTFQPVKYHRQILTNILPSQMGKKIIIADNISHKIRGRFGLWDVPGWVNALIHDCWVTAKIRSLPEVKLPIFGEFDPTEERLRKTLLYEWGTARLELELLLGDPLGNWGSFGETAIKNSNGYRYRKHRALDLMTDAPGFQLEEGYKIGVQLINVGFGDLTSQDKIDILGAWTQEFVAVQAQPPYVINNVYGSSQSPSPSPTPTPVVIPTLTLSLASSATTVNANNDEKINLIVTDIPVGTQLTGTWFKDGINTGIIESVITTGNVIQLSTLKLREKFSGLYKLRMFYNDTGYISNEVSVTVNAEVSLSLPSGVTSALTGTGTSITVEGKYWNSGTNITYTYNWLKDNVVIFTSTGGAKTATVNNGIFTFNLSATELQGATSGNYQLRLNIVEGTSTVAYLSKNTIPVVITNPATVSTTPGQVNIYGGTTYTHSVVLSHFVSGSVLATVWQKDGVDLPATAESKTFTPANNQMTYTKPSNFIYPTNAVGLYRVKVTVGGNTYFSNTCNVYSQNEMGGMG